MTQDDGDAQKEFGVDGGSLEKFVNVGAVTIEFAGEPTDGSLLTFKFLLDELPDVKCGQAGAVLLVHKEKSVNLQAPRGKFGGVVLSVVSVHNRKSVGASYLLPVPLLKALALPPVKRRATPEAHAEYVYMGSLCVDTYVSPQGGLSINTSYEASTAALSL